jgi:hypothetical protein
MHLKLTEKQEDAKRSRWKEITKIRSEMNKIGTKRTIQRVNETKKMVICKDKQN